MPNRTRISLDELEKKTVFTVPEGYFDQLPATVSQRVQSHATWASWTFSGWLRLSAGFACVVFICALAYLFYVRSGGDPAQRLAQVPDQEIIEYLHLHGELSQHEWIETAAKAGVQLDDVVIQELDPNQEMLLEELDQQTLEELM